MRRRSRVRIRMNRAVVLGVGVLGAAVALLAAAVPGAASPAAGPTPYFAVSRSAAFNVSGTYVPVVGHFSSLTLDDIVWYSPTGVDQRWTAGPGAVFTKPVLSPQIGGGYTPVVGDFAGDDHDDLYWYSPARADQLWTTSPSGAFQATTLDQAPGYTPIVLPDSDTGSGKDDLLWSPTAHPEAAATTPLWVFPNDGSGVPVTTGSVTRPGNAVPLVGDFDGDGDADVFWYRAGTAVDILWRRARGTSTTFATSNPVVNGNYVGRVGRFGANGDQRRDIVWSTTVYVPQIQFTYEQGPAYLWQGQANGTFTSVSTPTPQRASGIGLVLTGATRDDVVSLAVMSPYQDHVWSHTATGPVTRTTGNAERLFDEVSGLRATVTGRFTSAARDDLLLYKPGAPAESLWHPR